MPEQRQHCSSPLWSYLSVYTFFCEKDTRSLHICLDSIFPVCCKTKKHTIIVLHGWHLTSGGHHRDVRCGIHICVFLQQNNQNVQAMQCNETHTSSLTRVDMRRRGYCMCNIKRQINMRRRKPSTGRYNERKRLGHLERSIHSELYFKTYTTTSLLCSDKICGKKPRTG